MKDLRLVYIVGTYPSLTTTFIDRELSALRAAGIEVAVISIRRTEGLLSTEQTNTLRHVRTLLPCKLWDLFASHIRFALLDPVRYFGTAFYLLTRQHPSWKARFLTMMHFGEAVLAARQIECLGANHIHAHFVDRAATVALTASRLLDVPYSVTAHANDIYVKPLLLHEKLAAATFVATCTEYNKTFLQNVLRDRPDDHVVCVYHGLDTQLYNPATRWEAHRVEPKLVAVGQLKEKKGFKYLIQACKILRQRGYRFQCVIVGEGPLRTTLEDQIRQLSLNDTVTLLGAISHSEVVRQYETAAVFALPCVEASDGDRDGIPNVILEAMAMKLPVVATAHSGIPEVIEDGINGNLVTPADETALAETLAQLLDNPKLRSELGENARSTINRRFDINVNARRLYQHFRASELDLKTSEPSTSVAG